MHKTKENVSTVSTDFYPGTVIGTQSTSRQTDLPILPQRFNSTSQPSFGSIVRPELNSVSEPKTK
jgi:hypothetical protein